MAISGVGSTHSAVFPALQQLNRRQSLLFNQLGSGNLLVNAGVNPAGLALAQQLTSQVNGLEQAQSNSAAAIDLFNTAGSALSTTQDILQQERTLNLEAANGTLTQSDQQAIQAQIGQLNQGINDIANQTQFNTMPLLDGQAGGLTISGGGAVAESLSGIPGITNGTASIDVTALATSGQVTGGTVTSGTASSAGNVSISGPSGSQNFTLTAGQDVGQFVQQVNAAGIGVTASLNASGQLQFATDAGGSNQTVTLSNVSGSAATALGLANGSGSGTNATATVNGAGLTAQGNTFDVVGAAAGSLLGLQFTAGQTGTAVVTVSTHPGMTFQVGANAGQTLPGAIGAATTQQLGVAELNVAGGAEQGIAALDQALQAGGAQQATIGATVNGLQFAADNAATTQGNEQAARSLIADTNLASASTNLAGTLLQQRFALFGLQQQANAFALTSQLLVA